MFSEIFRTWPIGSGVRCCRKMRHSGIRLEECLDETGWPSSTGDKRDMDTVK